MADRRRSLILAGGIAATEGHVSLGPRPARHPSRLDLQVWPHRIYERPAEGAGIRQRARRRGPRRILKSDTGQDLDLRFENQAYDIELSNLHLVGVRHVVSYGGKYRYNNFDLSLAPRGSARNEKGVYVQDEIILSERLRSIVGVRLDAFDVLSKAVVSPRTTLLMKPRAGHTIRLSYNRAFRAPSFVNSYLEMSFRTTADLAIRGAVRVGGRRCRERPTRGGGAHGLRGGVCHHRRPGHGDRRRVPESNSRTPFNSRRPPAIPAARRRPGGRGPGRPRPADRGGPRTSVRVQLSQFRPHHRPWLRVVRGDTE